MAIAIPKAPSSDGLTTYEVVLNNGEVITCVIDDINTVIRLIGKCDTYIVREFYDDKISYISAQNISHFRFDRDSLL